MKFLFTGVKCCFCSKTYIIWFVTSCGRHIFLSAFVFTSSDFIQPSIFPGEFFQSWERKLSFQGGDYFQLTAFVQIWCIAKVFMDSELIHSFLHYNCKLFFFFCGEPKKNDLKSKETAWFWKLRWTVVFSPQQKTRCTENVVLMWNMVVAAWCLLLVSFTWSLILKKEKIWKSVSSAQMRCSVFICDKHFYFRP